MVPSAFLEKEICYAIFSSTVLMEKHTYQICRYYKIMLTWSRQHKRQDILQLSCWLETMMTCQWNKNTVLQLSFLNPLHKCREGVITWHQIFIVCSKWASGAAWLPKRGCPFRQEWECRAQLQGSLSGPICPLYWSDGSQERCCHFWVPHFKHWTDKLVSVDSGEEPCHFVMKP